MKRSEVNTLIKEARQVFAEKGFRMPDFADWSLDEWKIQKADCGEIIDCNLGWDVTDFGSGDYASCGLMLFTLRNGIVGSEAYPKPYAEKIMLVKPNQVTPMHCHLRKREDIINRGGGVLVFQLRSCLDGKPVEVPVLVSVNGRRRLIQPDELLRLLPGDSATMEPGMFHAFWGEEGTGAVMVGEVSSVNDDHTDNLFAEARSRFPGWEEDVLPTRLTVADYATFL